MIIDSHVHIWDPSTLDYPWLAQATPQTNRTVAYEEIIPGLRRMGIDGTILVQAVEDPKEIDLLRAAADRYESILGIVAWAPLGTPDDLRRLIPDLRSDPKIVGIRNLIHGRAPGWLLERANTGLELLARARFPLDFVTSDPEALVEVPQLLQMVPELRIVIDHLGKPPIGGDDDQRDRWRHLIREAAAEPTTCAKVSGLYSVSGDSASWTEEQVRPFIDDALDIFGPDRLMIGSDWPLSSVSGGHERGWNLVLNACQTLTDNERRQIFGGTAARFYDLPRKEIE